MSYDSNQKTVFIPTIEVAGYYDDSGVDPRSWKYKVGRANLGLDPFVGETTGATGSSALVAWDPIAQKKLWSVPTPGVWNGGTMATASGLVFQGWADGSFNAFDAKDGSKLWSFRAPNGISGAPISFAVDGRQYVAVVAGWGGSGAAYMGDLTAKFGWTARQTDHWLLIFALDGKATLPKFTPVEAATADCRYELPYRSGAGRRWCPCVQHELRYLPRHQCGGGGLCARSARVAGGGGFRRAEDCAPRRRTRVAGYAEI